jgi:hypothetical protein
LEWRCGLIIQLIFPKALTTYWLHICSEIRQLERLLVAYVPSDRSDGEAVLADASAALTRIGIATDESLLIQGGRYRSVLCQDQSCCPAEGNLIPEIDGSRIAVEHVVAGRAMPFANLQALTDSISSLPVAAGELSGVS